jgi:prepilin peptidase CpaA
MALTALHVAIIFIAAAIFVGAAVNDAYTYRIPNYLCALLLAMFPLFVATAPHSIDWQQNTAVFGLAIVAGFALFLGKMTGAGDVKLLAVAALWAGPHLIAVLLIVTAFVGGLESMVMAAAVYLRHRRANKKPRLIQIQIPYGIAIATGGLTMLGIMAQPILLPG